MTHQTIKIIRGPLFGVLFLTIGMTPALADPPGRVGRISVVEGVLSLRHADETQWSAAGINYPLIAGDNLWSDQNSRAEIDIAGSEARLDERTEIGIAELDDEATAVKIDQGVVNLTVRFVPVGGIRLLTAIGELDINRAGEYHVDVGPQGGAPTQLVLSVLYGEARFTGPRGTAELHAGQGAMAPPDNSLLTIVSAYPTPFDQWAENRAASLQLTQSVQYVSQEVTGYQDLGAYGRWETSGEYGPIWYPTRVEAGWAPYRDGHWAFVRPWGWTWIDDAPWGFAPFHYGRWVNFDGRWAWVPGARAERPCYAPALVAFVGGAPGLTISANIGWVPLGPREVFHPYYPVSRNYLVAVNRPHVTNVTVINQNEVTINRYVNHGAVTSVTPTNFTNSSPVRHNMAPAPVAGGAQTTQPVVLTNLNHLPPAQTAPMPAQAPPIRGNGPGFANQPPAPGPQPQNSAPTAHSTVPTAAPPVPASIAPSTAPPAQPRPAMPMQPAQAVPAPHNMPAQPAQTMPAQPLNRPAPPPSAAPAAPIAAPPVQPRPAMPAQPAPAAPPPPQFHPPAPAPQQQQQPRKDAPEREKDKDRAQH